MVGIFDRLSFLLLEITLQIVSLEIEGIEGTVIRVTTLCLYCSMQPWNIFTRSSCACTSSNACSRALDVLWFSTWSFVTSSFIRLVSSLARAEWPASFASRSSSSSQRSRRCCIVWLWRESSRLRVSISCCNSINRPEQFAWAALASLSSLIDRV